MSSGEYMQTANDALSACMDGMIEHTRTHLKVAIEAQRKVPA